MFEKIEKRIMESALEKLCSEIKEAGDLYADSKQISDRLEELKKITFSQLVLTYKRDEDRAAMGLCEHKARADIKYKKAIEEWVDAENATLKAKVRFEALKNLFDARRTQESTNREKIKQGIL